MLPIPAGFEFLPDTARPPPAKASVDGRVFEPLPLRRVVKLADGRIKEQLVPLAEYRALRWAIGDLAAGIVARVLLAAQLICSTEAAIREAAGTIRSSAERGAGVAIQATFKRRKTGLAAAAPGALTGEFAEHPLKVRQWQAFVERGRIKQVEANLAVVASAVRDFLMPVVAAAESGGKFSGHWPKVDHGNR